MTTTITKQLYIEADRLLASPEHWTQGELGDERRMCLMGALHLAAKKLGVKTTGPWEGTSVFRGAYTKLRQTIRKQIGVEVSHLAGFNDMRGTTFCDIKAVLRRAIYDAG